GAVSERIATVRHELEPLAALDPALAPQVERLSDAMAIVEDVARDLGRYARGVRSDPARLAEIDDRLFLLSRLTRKPGGTVADRDRFLFAPNPGDPPRPLARIASGGELSRVMLAVKQALARTDQVLTYVFDEVDAGIGGGAAEVIGRKLKRIAADRQVIVITH